MTQTTQLGSGFPEMTRSGDFIRQLQMDLEATLMRRVEDTIRGLKLQIPAPNVSVAPPQVLVAAPVINVEVSPADVDAPIVSMDLSTLSSSLTRIESTLTQLLQVSKQPITRTVIRDRDGNITSITEKRG
jgi:hypothetical protein